MSLTKERSSGSCGLAAHGTMMVDSWMPPGWPQHSGRERKARGGQILPPTRTAQPPGVHLAHVAHADEADGKVLGAREGRRRR